MAARGSGLEAAAFAAFEALHPGGRLGLAVSGGGDSLALMLLAQAWGGAPLAVATVDHGLRAGAAAEADFVMRRAEALGLAATTLRWRGWDGRGNLQAAARDGRAGLLADWARAQGLSAIALGHTLDDQAETLLMRLARGAGVDGLSAMAPRGRRAGALWLRPLLGLRRDALRDWLTARGETWCDDPSNDDPRFERIAVRRALAALEPIGLDATALAATAARMARARRALDAQTRALWSLAVSFGALGEARIARDQLAAAPREIAVRLVAAALRAVSGDPAPSRLRALEALVGALCAEAAMPCRSLHGCLASADGGVLILMREPRAALRAGPPVCGLWDGRWRIAATEPGVVRALGSDGEAALAAARAGGWRAPGPWRDAPRPARLATPALWRDAMLVCAPLAGFGAGLSAELVARDLR